MTMSRSLRVGEWALGTLFLVVPPASAQSLTLTVDQVAYLSIYEPFVVVTGTVSCEGDPQVIVGIRQRVQGQEIGTVSLDAGISCPAGTWSVFLRSDVGELGGAQFRPGMAEIMATAIICDPVEGCIVEDGETEILVLPAAANRVAVEDVTGFQSPPSAAWRSHRRRGVADVANETYRQQRTARDELS
jgi:hypothetical protein